jgi:hypothetical protein
LHRLALARTGRFEADTGGDGGVGGVGGVGDISHFGGSSTMQSSISNAKGSSKSSSGSQHSIVIVPHSPILNNKTRHDDVIKKPLTLIDDVIRPGVMIHLRFSFASHNTSRGR